MKVRLFSRGRGWYISCQNKNVNDDRFFINVYFKDGEEPYADMTGKEFVFTDIDVQEAQFKCSNKKPYMKVWKYENVDGSGALTEVEQENKDFAERVRGTEYEKNFGASQSVKIEDSDLPFY